MSKKNIIEYPFLVEDLILKLAEKKYINVCVNINGIKVKHGKPKKLLKTHSRHIIIEFEKGNEILSFHEIDRLFNIHKIDE